MDVLVPFVCTTESADYCYLQKHASTMKMFPLFECKVFEAARAEGMNFRSTERFIDQFFLCMELCGSDPPPHLSVQWTTPQVPPSLFVSTVESSTAWFLSFCEWRRLAAILRGWIFKLFESSCSDKVCHSGPLSRPSQPGTMINPTAPTALLTCLSLALLN